MIAHELQRGVRSRGNGNPLPELVGDDQCVQDLRSRIRSIGNHDCTVLICGESGTGKELVARHIHAAGARAGAPFVIADCTALPDGLFESQLFGHVKGAFTGAVHATLGLFRAADGGTLFIDEIGELALPMQAKLLRCIQEHSVLPVGAVDPVQADVRIIAATHRDLTGMVRRGEFREDLYYRLDVVRVQVPPLRARGSDVTQLTEYFLKGLARRYDVPEKVFSPDAMEALGGYSWPGNVRELSNVIESAAVSTTSGHLTLANLSEKVRNTTSGHAPADSRRDDKIQPLHVVERQVIEQALRATKGNQSQAAQLLQVERHRLSRLIGRHKLTTLVNSLRWSVPAQTESQSRDARPGGNGRASHPDDTPDRRDMGKSALHAFLLAAILMPTFWFGRPAWGQTVIIEHPEAREIALRNGWLIRKETPTGVMELAAIVGGFPWYNTTFNAAAADSISTDECFSGGSGGLTLSGSGVTLGIWDAGGVRLTHQEFGSRANQVDLQSITHWHSTHVAGTMIASGVVTAATGMSPSAYLDCYDWTYDITEMQSAAAAGLRVSNHSYGFVQGWYYDSVNDEYYWFGDRAVSNDEDYRFGLYGGYSYGLDLVASNYPYYLICRSAGNDRADEGPTGPEPVHFHWKLPFQVEWEDAIDTHDPDGDYDSITTRNTAKNILTVGAVDDVAGGYSGPSSVVMSSFSGWGPCDDGRIKPDIVANGINLYSADDATDTAYNTLSGTSMAAPNAAGSLGVLIEHWRATHAAESDMRSATLKGLVIHTADEAGAADGPDYEYGWGLMNTLAAANVISDDATDPLTITEWGLFDGDWVELLITTDGTSDLWATICWTDPPGPWQNNVVDPTTKILVNDLDLRIERISPPATYLPWVLNLAFPSTAATNGDNDTDNVEQVVVHSPGVDNFILRVTHKAALYGGSQAFSAIITGAAQIQVSAAAIAGSITTPAATAIPNVVVSGANSGESDVTDAAGYYELPLRIGGSETVTPCLDGWLFAPSARLYTPVVGNLGTEDFTGTLVYDIDPPGTGDAFVGVGDLSQFALSWQQTVPPANALHDFDCDLTVGAGDFSYFATAWLDNVFDAGILIPACRLCGGRAARGEDGEVQLEVHLVATLTPSPEDLARELPTSTSWIGVGQTYFVEMWLRDMGEAGPGVTSAYAHLVFGTEDAFGVRRATTAQAVSPSEIFSTLDSGSIGRMTVKDLGGSALAAGVGTEGLWARVATVELDATGPGRVRYSLLESPMGFAAYGSGLLPWDNIEPSGVTVDHVEPQDTTSQNENLSTGDPSGGDLWYNCDKRAGLIPPW